jgi:hypothetical protein
MVDHHLVSTCPSIRACEGNNPDDEEQSVLSNAVNSESSRLRVFAFRLHTVHGSAIREFGRGACRCGDFLRPLSNTISEAAIGLYMVRDCGCGRNLHHRYGTAFVVEGNIGTSRAAVRRMGHCSGSICVGLRQNPKLCEQADKNPSIVTSATI